MTRIVPVIVLVASLVTSGGARAQTTLDGGVTLKFDKLFVYNAPNTTPVEPNPETTDVWSHFNLAHCECGLAKPDHVESKFEYLITASATTPTLNQPVEIWVGSTCDTSDSRAVNTNLCHKINTISSISTIQSSRNVHVSVPVFDVMNPEPSNKTMCMKRRLTGTIWALADAMSASGKLDYSSKVAIATDTEPPPEPTNFRGAGIDSGVEISWTPPSDTSDVLGYQVLCATASNDFSVKKSDVPTKKYMTSTTVCSLPAPGITVNERPISVQASPTDAGAGASAKPTGGLAALNSEFLCGETMSQTASSVTVSGLTNGVAYKFILLAVDKYQNAWATSFTSTITPAPSTDFWEDLHGNGSDAQGGLCLLAETYGDDSGLTGALRAFRDNTLGGSRAGRWLTRIYYTTLGKLGGYVHGSLALRIATAIVLAPVVALALLWHWLGLPGLFVLLVAAWWAWRRRAAVLRRLRRRIASSGVAAASALAVLALAPGSARAGGYEPYWENDPMANDEARQGLGEDPSDVTWHVGVRIGPYTPDIDDQLGKSPGPFQRMFGSSLILPVLDVDRILWRGYGQAAVGISAGYTQKLAHTFVVASNPSMAPTNQRTADTNRFHLLPLALTATYRFTVLDDDYGIPIVPYVRAGLSYYVWWIDLPKQAGSPLAKVCKDAGTEPDCSQNKALGGSLGVQGSIGLAIRAERIDATAAMSMRQSGIQHAGIYAELSLAKVNGFGSDKKLSVGARTWFAGVDFEF